MINTADQTIRTRLKQMRWQWMAAGFLPLPILLTTDPKTNADPSCLYLGIASAWLATEFFRGNSRTISRSEWMTNIAGLSLALALDVAIFIALGRSVDVQSTFPFPLKAVLSALPAIGIVLWLVLRMRQPVAAMLACALLLLASKLAGCVVARIVYGPDFLERGYVAGNWHTAKLMISIFWGLSTTISMSLLLADYLRLGRRFGSHRLEIPAAIP